MTSPAFGSAAPRRLDVRAWQLWGKADPARTEKGGPAWHPLLCHVLDVVACAQILLTEICPGRLDALAHALGLSQEEALPWLLFSIALHDLGKATPAFQGKVPARKEALAPLGFDFSDANEPHGSLSALLGPAELERYGCPPRLARALARAVGAHHGDFASLEHLENLREDLARQAGRKPPWADVRAELVSALAHLTGVSAAPPPSLPGTPTMRNSVLADLAGLTTVADWVGSNADVFAYVEPPESPESYYACALNQARSALEEAGFRRSPRPLARGFHELFGKPPWPLHDAIADIVTELSPGALVIVEAPMGEGKTEAALLIYDTLASRSAEGLYFALPTQATSNQILGRVERYLAASFRGETHGLHLVHGGAGLSDRYGKLKQRAFSVSSIGDVAKQSGDQGPIADAWFARPKRALLAPIAVGTVDQALLGVLRSKHHFLRLHGLARKVVVVDEVHAYETFTAEILARLCAWLRALGATVILLSATLASRQRARILAAYDVTEPLTCSSYPRITVARDGVARSSPFPARRAAVDVTIGWRDETSLREDVARAVATGGCVAWIVNTVARAQATYKELSAMKDRGLLAPDVELSLLHARFPFAARQTRERAAEEAFGPPELAKSRPRAAILVGTQVLEQSLDLDFDLMVTDLAPVDLVIQRAGRLHRHNRSSRPAGLETPQLWIAKPANEDNPAGPDFGPSASVYDESVLLRTWLALRSRSCIRLPSDIEPLVETVYTAPPAADLPARLAERLRTLDAAQENENRSDTRNAEARELRHPEESDPFRDFRIRFGVDDEDPNLHEALRAVTRLGEASVSVVPVIERDSRLVLASDPRVTVRTEGDELPYGDVIAIARQTLAVSRKAVVRALLEQAPPPAFQRSGHLRHHRLLRLDAQAEAVIAGTRIRLDPNLGLVVGDLSPLAEPS